MTGEFQRQFGEESRRGQNVPDAWVGQRVSALMVRSGGYEPRTYQARPLTGEWGRGVLEGVNERGIIASLTFYEDEAPTPGVFYPWGAVLSLQPDDGQGN